MAFFWSFPRTPSAARPLSRVRRDTTSWRPTLEALEDRTLLTTSHFSLVAPPSQVAGSSFNLSVTARDASDRTLASYRGTIHFTSTDHAAAVALPADYTFTTTDQGVHTFSGVSVVTTPSQTITGTDTVTASMTGTASVTVTPAAANTFTVSGFPKSVIAGTTGSFSVTAQDAFGNVATGYSGLIHFTSSDAQAVLPADSGLANGAGSFSAALKTAGTQSITATDTTNAALTGTEGAITVSAASAAKYVLAAPATAVAGVPFSVTVSVEDQFGNVATTYMRTAHFTSSDNVATLPANYTFTGADQGVHTFTNGVSLLTAGNQAITATDVVTPVITGSAAIRVNGAAATHYTVSAPAAVTAGAAFSVTVAARDQFNNVASGYTGTADFLSSDLAASLPNDYQFTATDAGMHTFDGVSLQTAGAQTVRATDSANSSIVGIVAVSVTAAAATNFNFAIVASSQAGMPFSVTVAAQDPFGNVDATYRGTIHFTSSDPNAVLPPDYVFANADAGRHFFNNGATLRLAGTESVTATDVADSMRTGTGSLTITPASASHLDVSAPTATTAGGAFTISVVARDQFGNVATTYAKSVHFSSTDIRATLPTNYTFTSGDQGIHTFTGAVLTAAGAQTITAIDSLPGQISGIIGVAVRAAAANHFALTAPSRVKAGAALAVTVLAEDPFNNTDSGYVQTVHFSSSDALGTLPANYTFTATDAGAHTFASVYLRSDSSASVAVTDIATPAITGSTLVSVLPVYLATGADAGGGPEVKVINPITGVLKFDFFAYATHFSGGVRVAVADVTGDGTPDIITAPGPGGGPDIRVWDGTTGRRILEFFAYNPAFTGGVFVAAGDVNGDGKADIILGPDATGGPDVRVYNSAGALIQEMIAYNPAFTGGVRVAAGDVDADGKADIITGPGTGGGPDVRAFSGDTGAMIREVIAYDPTFTGGIFVAAGDVNGDGKADIITGPGRGGGPQVKVFSGLDGSLYQSFNAYDPGFTGGVRVGIVSDLNGDGKADILTAAGPGGGPHVKMIDGVNLFLIDSLFAYDPAFAGGVFIGGQ